MRGGVVQVHAVPAAEHQKFCTTNGPGASDCFVPFMQLLLVSAQVQLRL